MLKVEIVNGHHEAKSRSTKNGMRFYQEAYAHLGGAFPQQIEVPLKTAADALPIGEYSLNIESFQVGRFKNLEINPFELKLSPVTKSFSKAS